MKQMFTFALLAIFSLCCVESVSAQSTKITKKNTSRSIRSSTQHSVSQKRIATIKKIIERFTTAKKNCKRRVIRLELIEALENEMDCPVIPLVKVDLRTTDMLERIALTEISRTYPYTISKFEVKVKGDAYKQFGHIKNGDFVKVKIFTSKGDEIKSGVYQGYCDNNRKIRIEDEAFLLRDVDPSFLERLDEAKSKSKQEDYVNKLVSDYNFKKRRAYDAAIGQQKRLQQEKNESEGYLFYNDKWVSCETVMDDLITQLPDMEELEKEKELEKKRALDAERTLAEMKKLQAREKAKSLKAQQSAELLMPNVDTNQQKTDSIAQNPTLIKQISDSFVQQTNAWNEKARKFNADALSGLDSIPWFAEKSDIELFLHNAKNLNVSDTQITFDLDSDYIIASLPVSITIELYNKRMIRFIKHYPITSQTQVFLLKQAIENIIGKATNPPYNWMGFDFKVEAKLTPKYNEKAEPLYFRYMFGAYDGERTINKLPPAK